MQDQPTKSGHPQTPHGNHVQRPRTDHRGSEESSRAVQRGQSKPAEQAHGRRPEPRRLGFGHPGRDSGLKEEASRQRQGSGVADGSRTKGARARFASAKAKSPAGRGSLHRTFCAVASCLAGDWRRAPDLHQPDESRVAFRRTAVGCRMADFWGLAETGFI
jgi:hypothetical protein